jgi:glycosyltransferase involved in cell wall biosynthesis
VTEAPPPSHADAAPSVAVLIPCLDEESTIGGMVAEFRKVLPGAAIYVYDNGSRDRTVDRAAAAGAVVRHEKRRGKGNVVRRMFADIDADVYVIVDGDATYDVSAAPELVQRLLAGPCDMVNVARAGGTGAYRPGHRWGNRLFTTLVRRLFGAGVGDVLSGYRAFSRRYVKSFPALSRGFEIETEMTVHALELRMAVDEFEAPYAARPPGSSSKLSSFKDAARIAATIFLLLKESRPLLVFGGIGIACAALSLLLAVPLFITYAQTGLVPRLPTGVLATGLMLLGFQSAGIGFVLDSVARGRREAKRLAYLRFTPPPSG